MQADDPPFLPVGTDVSAKYKGAFCEAKIKKVVKNIKCKVSFKTVGSGSVTVTDEAIKGTLRVGNTVEVRQDPKKDPQDAIITKIQDCSQYTVVFDDGDITTLRRSALCLKSGRHFAESETLDQLPLTHPEHFGNPVIGSSSRRGRRTDRSQSDDSDSEATDTITTSNIEREPHTGRVVMVQCGGSGNTSAGSDKKRQQSNIAAQGWFPGLVVSPGAQDTVKIKVKEDYLVRSFKDGRYYTVPKKEAKEFKRLVTNSEMGGMEAALQYLDKDVLPAHWDRDVLFGQEPQSDDVDSDDSSDDEPREEKDHFVAQLCKFMDDRGTPLNRQPTIANKDIDLYRLFKVVQKLGGYNRVTNQNQWKGIAIRLGFQPATTSVTNLCEQAYKKFLHSFEEFYRKLGVTLVARPRGGRSTGRSLIRDRDEIPPSSPAHSLKEDEKPIEKVITPKSKEAEKEKEKEKEIKVEKEPEPKEKETPKTPKETVEVIVKEKEPKIKEKEIKKEPKRETSRESKPKPKKEVKVKTEVVPSSEEEDSGDNQPLAPLSNKLEKSSSEAALSDKSVKITETPMKKVYKTTVIAEGTAGKRGLDRGEKGSVKKLSQRRGSSARTASKESVKEGRGKSIPDSTPIKKQDEPKSKEKDTTSTLSTKKGSSSDKNDSDSSSRGSKNGKTPSRRNATPTDTPPSTPGSTSGSQQHKKPRKRKFVDSTDKNNPFISCDVGDKLKVYYGPAQSESKVTYEAKVIEVSGRGADTLLRVHYTGWNTRYDEWIKPGRIADNLTQKNRHKDKGKRKSGGRPSESPSGKKSRQTSLPGHSASSSKTRARNRSSSNNTTTSNQQTTDVQSDSDSECESDSSGQRGLKKNLDDKISKDRGSSDSSSAVDKVLENEKIKISRMGRVSRSPQVKRSAENAAGGTYSRIKRNKIRQDDRDTPRGRDFDLNQIRSELKGFEKTIKTPIVDNIKVEPDAEPAMESPPTITIKQEKTPDKVTEDIYEFKEPEPFEFEARKSEEKKKRPTHRIFDDLPQLKLSPTRPTVKSPVNTEGHKSPQPVKSHYDSVFDKLYESQNYNDENISNQAGKESEALLIFNELGNEDSGDRLQISENEDSQGTLFSYQTDIFVEKPCLPIFKGFTPAKNQETYSKKDAANKMREIDDDLTGSSSLKGEHSSDEDPIGTAIKRVNDHSMSDDSNDSELLKTPTIPDSAPSTSSAVVSTESKTTTTETKPNSTIVDIKPKPTTAVPKTKSPLLEIKTKSTILEIKTTSPGSEQKPKAPTVEVVKTRSPLLDIKTKPSLLEQKNVVSTADAKTKPTLIDIKTKSPVIEIKAKVTTADVKTKTSITDVKSKPSIFEIKPKVQQTTDVKTPLQDTAVAKDCIVEVGESSKVEEVVEKIAPVVEIVNESVKTKLDISSIILPSKESIPECSIKDEPQEKKETISSALSDSDSHLDSKMESDVGSFADIVIPDPPPFLIQKEGTSIADKVLKAISNNKRAATPTPKDSKQTAKPDTSTKFSKVQPTPKAQVSKVTSTNIGISDTLKTSLAESGANVQGSMFSLEVKDTSKIGSKSNIPLLKDINKDLSVNEFFCKMESSDSFKGKDSMEGRRSGVEPVPLGGKSNKVLSETIQKLSSRISRPTPPLPEFKDERSEDSDSSESDRRLIIDKLSEEESQSGLSEGPTSQAPKMMFEKSASSWGETDVQKDNENEKNSNTDSSAVKDGAFSKVTEEDSNISILLCEETIPGSPSPDNVADGAKTTSKQKTRNLEIPFASAPSISQDQSKDPLSLKDLSRDNGRENMGSSRADKERERERDRDRDLERLGIEANTVDAVMDNAPPITPDSSLDNMSPSRGQLLSDGDNPAEMSKPSGGENRASVISKKLHDVEKSTSGSNLRSSAPGGPIVGGARRGRRPRSLRASEGEDHHRNTSGSSVGARSSPQYHTTRPTRPLRYNFCVELDEGMDPPSRIALLTSRLTDLKKAYHDVKAELAAIDRRRKKLRRKEREAVKAAKAACST